LKERFAAPVALHDVPSMTVPEKDTGGAEITPGLGALL